MSKAKKATDFRPNDFVVYPAHGVGRIVSIDEQEVAGLRLEMFVISFEGLVFGPHLWQALR